MNKQNTTLRGFSLVELCIVLTLVAILAVFAAPKLIPSRLDGAAHQVMADLRTAQALATTTTQPHGFKANSNTQYQIYRQTPNTYAIDPQTKGNFIITLSTRFPGVTLGSAAYQIEFDASGRPTTGGGTTILLRENGRTKTITVTANTGAITM